MLFTQNHNHDPCLNFFTLHTLFDDQGGEIYTYIYYILYMYYAVICLSLQKRLKQIFYETYGEFVAPL